jgi:hypothetical protein
MNPVTSFLVFVCILAAAAVGYLVDPYLALAFLAAGALIASSLKMANVWQKFAVQALYAMSRQAQAEREKQARVILGSAEAAIAGKFVEAANNYAGHPWSLQLRAMNIIYETTKERGATSCCRARWSTASILPLRRWHLHLRAPPQPSRSSSCLENRSCGEPN